VTSSTRIATGTKVGDSGSRARDPCRLRRGHATPVSAHKALTGHSLGTFGVVDMERNARWWRPGCRAADVQPDDPDTACAGETSERHRWPLRPGVVRNSFGFGGQNVSMLLARRAPPTQWRLTGMAGLVRAENACWAWCQAWWARAVLLRVGRKTGCRGPAGRRPANGHRTGPNAVPIRRAGRAAERPGALGLLRYAGRRL